MITITPKATEYLRNSLISGPTNALGIRIGLRDAGCSGFAYTTDFAHELQTDDQVFAFDGVQIVVAQKFMQALHGTEIDYVTQGVNSILQFNNPNVVNSCGCGESFQFKDGAKVTEL